MVRLPAMTTFIRPGKVWNVQGSKIEYRFCQISVKRIKVRKSLSSSGVFLTF